MYTFYINMDLVKIKRLNIMLNWKNVILNLLN